MIYFERVYVDFQGFYYFCNLECLNNVFNNLFYFGMVEGWC